MFQRQKDFGKQPSNYVPGRGRGAVGFITRSDIGPAKVDIGIEQDDDQNDYNDAKYDEWNGYSIPLFNMGDYDDEDKEADITYNNVDRRMEERRQRKLFNNMPEKPSIVNQFSDLKRELAGVSVDEWLSIPDIGDYSIKKKKQDKITPVPDSVIMSAQIQEKNLQTQAHDLNEIGEARGALLSLKLDKISDNVSGQSVVDKRGYLTSLASLPQLTENEIGDFKKARLLLKSVIQTDPKNSFGWIAAARVEELDGKLPAARSILAQGLQQAEDQEDIWIELSRLETPEKAKLILNKAIQTLPHSIKIWLNAANKESDVQAKIKILKRALEFIPNSVDIWKELVSLSTEQEALVLLYKAVECIPKNLSLWLALAKLETYDNAKAILNRARQNLPQEPTIWINAAKLEESAGKDKQAIAIVLSKGMKILKKNQVRIVREDWLSEAEIAEKCQNINTCYAIIKALMLEEVQQSDNQWKQEFQQFESRGSLHSARAIIGVEAERSNDVEIWKQFIDFERRHKSENPKYFDDVLNLALQYMPQVEQFWIELILRKNELGENYLNVYEQSPKSENILLTLSKLEKQKGNYEQAYVYLHQIQGNTNQTEKTWIKIIKLLILMNKPIEQAEEALIQYPQSDKLWILCAKIKMNFKDFQGARSLFEQAVTKLNNNLNVWLAYIQMECQLSLFTRARPLVDRAREKNPKNADLWAQSIRLEIDARNLKIAQHLLSKALQECQLNGELWSLAIELEPKNTRKKKSADAVTLCVDNPHVYLSTAKIFLKEGKIEKARRWLEKALILEPRLGDAWAYLYLIDKEVLGQCILKRPKSGRLWKLATENLNQKYDIEKILIETTKLAQKDLAKIE